MGLKKYLILPPLGLLRNTDSTDHFLLVLGVLGANWMGYGRMTTRHSMLTLLLETRLAA